MTIKRLDSSEVIFQQLESYPSTDRREMPRRSRSPCEEKTDHRGRNIIADRELSPVRERGERKVADDGFGTISEKDWQELAERFKLGQKGSRTSIANFGWFYNCENNAAQKTPSSPRGPTEVSHTNSSPQESEDELVFIDMDESSSEPPNSQEAGALLVEKIDLTGVDLATLDSILSTLEDNPPNLPTTLFSEVVLEHSPQPESSLSSDSLPPPPPVLNKSFTASPFLNHRTRTLPKPPSHSISFLNHHSRPLPKPPSKEPNQQPTAAPSENNSITNKPWTHLSSTKRLLSRTDINLEPPKRSFARRLTTSLSLAAIPLKNTHIKAF